MYQLNIKESKALEMGIDVNRLKAGTILLITTKNNLYKLIKTDREGVVYAQGGKYFTEPTEVYFSGSTFGGSMIKIGWIGYGMIMEMHIIEKKKGIKTSPVQTARVIGNGWEYDLDWADITTAKITEGE
jgi:hypothetical protein